MVYLSSFFQVFADFEVYGGVLGLASCCLYGGAPYQAQEMKLKRGVDIVVGTPGRIKVVLYSYVVEYYKTLKPCFVFT